MLLIKVVDHPIRNYRLMVIKNNSSYKPQYHLTLQIVILLLPPLLLVRVHHVDVDSQVHLEENWQVLMIMMEVGQKIAGKACRFRMSYIYLLLSETLAYPGSINELRIFNSTLGASLP